MEHHLPKVRFFCFYLTYDSRKLSWVVGKTSTGSKTESKILKGGHFMTKTKKYPKPKECFGYFAYFYINLFMLNIASSK